MKTVISVPTINANDEVVVIVRWHVADGMQIEAGVPLVDVETTKAVATVQADHSGWVRRCCIEGDELPVGADLAWVFSKEDELPPVVDKAEAKPADSPKALPTREAPRPNGLPTTPMADLTPSEVPPAFSTTRFSPLAEELATRMLVDLDALKKENLGLITSAMVRAWVGQSGALADPASPPAAAADGIRRERIPAGKRAEIDALRQGAGEHLNSSLTIYLNSREIRARAEESGYGLLPLVIAELSPLLKGNPKFTAFAEGNEIGFHNAVHLGVAIDLGDGLRVVTIRDADQLDAAAISERLADLTLDYMGKVLTAGSVQGATFTVTDLTGLDILHFKPLINGRQSAILGIGADSAQAGHPMTLTITFDHRVLTGREVGELLQALRGRLLAHAIAPSAAGTEQDKANLPCCDVCLTDLASYYEEFGQQTYAHMLQYMRRDGSSGLICHRCQAGYL